MSYNPDPIFRDGLNGYRKPAPPSAWERIESGLERKRQKSIWLKIAAGLFLILSTSVLLFQHDQTDSVVTTNSEETSVTTTKPETIASVEKAESKSTLRESSVVSREIKSESLQSQVIVEGSRNNHPNSVTENLPVVERTRAERSRSSRNEHVANHRSIDTQSQNPNVVSNESERKIVDPITSSGETTEIVTVEKATETNHANLTYTADQVNAKFIKQNVVPEATPAKKNASGLKTVIDKAVELTNDGTVFGEIREKKNEWLSFNNLSNKTEPNK